MYIDNFNQAEIIKNISDNIKISGINKDGYNIKISLT